MLSQIDHSYAYHRTVRPLAIQREGLAVNRVPFENYGRFYGGHVKYRRGDKWVKRRCLCFELKAEHIVGASAHFSRAEAFHNATRARDGVLPLPEPGLPVGATLAAVLKIRGFPVTDIYDVEAEIDDTTAGLLGVEFSKGNEKSRS